MHQLKGKKQLWTKNAEEDNEDDTEDSDADDPSDNEEDDDEEDGDGSEEDDDGSEEEDDDDDESDEEDENPAQKLNNKKLVTGKGPKPAMPFQLAESDEDDSDDEEEVVGNDSLKKQKHLTASLKDLMKGLESGDLDNSDDDEDFEEGDEEEDDDDEDESDDDDDESEEEPAGKKSKQIGKQLVNQENESDDSDDSDDSEEPTELSNQKAMQQVKQAKLKVPQKQEKAKPPKESVTTPEDLRAKLEKMKGKSLYILFPKQLPVEVDLCEANVKQLNPRIITVRRPRQKGARFCLVDFDSTQDRDKAFKELQKVEVEGKRLHVRIPKTESNDFIEELVEKRRQSRLAKRAKRKLAKAAAKKAAEAGKLPKNFTSTIMVRNIPISATADEIKTHFPSAIEFRLVYAKGPHETNSAIVTLPTPLDATKAYRQKIKIGETKLAISFPGDGDDKKKTNIKMPKKDGAAVKPAKVATDKPALKAIGISQNLQPDGKKMKQKQKKKEQQSGAKKPEHAKPANPTSIKNDKQPTISPEKQQNSQPNQLSKKQLKKLKQQANQQNNSTNQQNKPNPLNSPNQNPKKRKISTGDESDNASAKKSKPQSETNAHQPPAAGNQQKGFMKQKNKQNQQQQQQKSPQHQKSPHQKWPQQKPKFGGGGGAGRDGNESKKPFQKKPFNKNPNQGNAGKKPFQKPHNKPQSFQNNKPKFAKGGKPGGGGGGKPGKFNKKPMKS